MKRERSARQGPVTVYLNGRGGRIQGGYEDSSANRSSLVWSEGLAAIDVPAYAGGSQRWSEMVSCVQGHLRDYDIRVTDRRPEDGPYIMMMVGGRSSMLRYPGSVAGVAPYTGSVVEDAIGFVFSRTIGGGAQAVCETTSHEIGHTLGLDHTYECSDLMSYLGGCGEKSFRDEAMRCGEWDDRSCSGGQRHQNSHQHLAAALGLRPSRPEPNPPSRVPTTPADTRGPRISVHSAGGSTFEAESIFIVQFDVFDDSGLASLELLWQVDGRTIALRCGDLPDDLPVECGMIGGSYAFALAVGAGERKYAIRVTDEAGNRSTTRWRRASFVEPDLDEDWDDGGSCD